MNDFSKLLKLYMESEDATGSGVEAPGPGPGPSPITTKGAKDPHTLFIGYMNELDPLWKDLHMYLTDVMTQLNATAGRLKGTFDDSAARVKDQNLTSAGLRKVTAARPDVAARLAAMRGQYQGTPVSTVRMQGKDVVEEPHPSGARRFSGGNT
jgi:hypothetical protein